MKRLLVLGGIRAACEIVKKAKSMGIETHVTDYLENSPAKQFADYSHMTSTMDVDAVTQLCREIGIDGVFTGYIDSLLPSCQRICEKLKIPFWGDAQNIEMCVHKELFKRACEKAGVPVVPWRKANKDNYKEILATINPPVVIKPADNSGSRGVYKCYEYSELVKAAESALKMSKSGELIIEKLMRADSEFSLYYMIRNGHASLSAMGDRYVNNQYKELAPIGQGMLYPSVHLNEWMVEGDPLIQRFFEQNRMRDGFVFLQGFYEDGFYLHEIGYRLNGGFTYNIIEHFSKYNQLEELINYSLTGAMNDKNESFDSPFFKGYGMIVTVSLRPGIIGHITGVSEIEAHPNVLHFYQLHEPGDHLGSYGTTAQNFAFILCASETEDGIRKAITFIQDHLVVLNTEGQNMLNIIIDPDNIVFKRR